MVTIKQPAEEAPCKRACPAGVDIPRYIRYINQGKFGEAVAVIRERIPFPSVCGWVCLHPCEAKCRLNEVDGSVAINALKRFATEKASGSGGDALKAGPTGKRVAVIGSGPAGLSAAYYLTKLGHSLTVFESLPEAGGMMRVGIPEYRLPREVLDAEIETIKGIGVDIRTNTRIDSTRKLLKDGYDAVFVAIGAHQGVKMGLEGEGIPGVMECISFLKELNSGKELSLGDKVVVIGGGNAAIDAARSALRLGAKEVIILYRRTREEMPASAEEVEEALQEGVGIRFLAAPIMIVKQDNRINMECIRMRLGEIDASGRRRPEPIKGSEFTISADTVIAAIGQMPQIPPKLGLAIGEENRIEVAPETLATSRKGVFAGGDATTGPASVIEAIAAGRRAAISIDKFLGGRGIIEEVLAPPEEVVTPIMQGLPIAARSPMPLLPVDQRLSGFAQVELGFGEEAALVESSRCLICDLPIMMDAAKCVGCFVCMLRCSLRFEKAFNPAKAAISIGPQFEKENDISFTDKCDVCGICARFCPYGALTRQKR